MKKILALCLCLCMAFTSLTCVAYAADTMEVDLTSDRYGHIYTDAGQNFNISVKNTLAVDFSGKIKYEILSGGTAISTTEKDVTIAAGGTYTDSPVLPLSKYGIFQLKASIMQGNGVCGTDTIPFSYINASKNGEGSEKMYVNTHIEDSTRDNENTINLVRDAGFGGMRTPVYWFTVETNNKNEYKMPEHTEYIIDSAKKGMEPLVVLSGGNGPWGCINEAGNNLNMAPSTTEQIQAFANYCAYVATQLKGYVKHYEIWNEFTMDGSNAGNKSGAAYAKILIAASKAIKAVDADAKIVAMCTAGMDWSFINSVTTQLRNQGETNCYDILSVHPYTYGTSHGNPNTSTLTAIKYLAGTKPIWFTERGWDTSTTVNSSTNGITDEKQAIYGVLDYLNLVSNLAPNGYGTRFFWYDFQDDGTNAAEREQNFGLIESVNATVPGAAKPAYVAFAALNKIVGQATYKSKSTSGSTTAYRFTDEHNEDIFVITGSVGSTITISTSAPKLDIMDRYSNVVSIPNVNGSYQVPLTDEVMYVRRHYEPAGCTLSVANGKLSISGHTMESNQQVSVMVTNADNELIYVGQTTCDSERAYSFTADRKIIDELYVRVNYGDIFNGDVDAAIVLKLTCNGEKIEALKDITSTDNLNLVVSLNDNVKAATDVHVAVYNGNTLESYNGITLNTNTALGDHSIKITINENVSYDKISGFVWEDLNPIMDKVDFK